MFYLILFRKVHKRVFFPFFREKIKKEMYREQNYIFSFTFVYKSKTACLKKNTCKKNKKKERKEKKEKKKTSTHKPPSVYFFWILKIFFFIVCPMVLVLFYFNGIILFAITEKELHVWSFKLWAFLCCGEGAGGDSFNFIF